MKRLLATSAILGAMLAPACAQGLPNYGTTNASVSITTGNTFQQVLAAGARRSITIQNNNATDNCWVFIGAGSATVATSILLTPGGAYGRYNGSYVPQDVIQATCATNGDKLYVDWQ